MIRATKNMQSWVERVMLLKSWIVYITVARTVPKFRQH